MRTTDIQLSEEYSVQQEAMEVLSKENFNVKQSLADCNPQALSIVEEFYHRLSQRKRPDFLGYLTNIDDISFEVSFAGMLLVIIGTNNLIRKELFPGTSSIDFTTVGVAFLTRMSMKEAWVGLSSDEIAGMSAAGTIDILFRLPVPQIVETCGTGGDRAWGEEAKTINISTLSAMVLASLGIPTLKHGSYSYNPFRGSKVKSRDVFTNFGAKVDQYPSSRILNLFRETNLWFGDALSVKTFHYLSHLTGVETIGHIVGPMTLPIAKETKLFKVMGVNHNTHPEVVARAYTILHRKGFINLGGVVVLTGLDKVPQGREYLDPAWVKKHSFLDEVSPYATLVSVAKRDKFLGNFILTDESFGGNPLQEEKLKVSNDTSSLMKANQMALMGIDRALADYLARNVALGLLLFEGLKDDRPFSNLPCYYQRGFTIH